MRQGDHPIGKAERIVLMLLVIVLSSALALYAWTQYRSPSPGAVAALAPSPSSDSTTASAPPPELRKGVHSAPERRDSAQRLVTSPDYVGPPSGTERAVVKYQHYVSLDLNAVDSLTLLRVPGIGPAFAHRILSLRSRLGATIRCCSCRRSMGWMPTASSSCGHGSPSVRRRASIRSPRCVPTRCPGIPTSTARSCRACASGCCVRDTASAGVTYAKALPSVVRIVSAWRLTSPTAFTQYIDHIL